MEIQRVFVTNENKEIYFFIRYLGLISIFVPREEEDETVVGAYGGMEDEGYEVGTIRNHRDTYSAMPKLTKLIKPGRHFYVFHRGRQEEYYFGEVVDVSDGEEDYANLSGGEILRQLNLDDILGDPNI